MAECIEQTQQDLLDLDLDEHDRITHAGVGATKAQRHVSFPSSVVGHVGDGNFHVFFIIDPSSPRELALATAINDRMVRRAIEMDGTCTGEHGVGTGKKKYLEFEHGRPAVDLMRTVKAAIDPELLMNPGKVFDMKTKEEEEGKIGALKKPHLPCCE